MNRRPVHRWFPLARFVRRGFPRAEGSFLRLVILTVVVGAVMTALNPGRFLTGANLESMGFQFPELALLSLAMTLAMLTGGIDLSVVAIANLSGILAAWVLTAELPGALPQHGAAVRVSLAAIAALLCGAGCGSVNGLLISRIRISPILATLGTMQLFLGTALVATRGRSILGFPEPFLALGNGRLMGLPVPFVLLVVVALVLAVVSSRTALGIHLRLLGTNPVAAAFSGIRVRSVLYRTYLTTGVIAGITGLLMIARTNSAKAEYGSSYLLQSILVAVLGGVDPAGGSGSVRGVCVAVVALQMLASGLNMLHLSNFAKEFVWGAFLLLIMVINQMDHRLRNQG